MAILEKRLIYNNSKIQYEETVHNITDLEACYDRQLANIGSIVKESVSINRKIAQLIAKVIPVFKHYVCTSYGISIHFYSGQFDLLAGTG